MSVTLAQVSPHRSYPVYFIKTTTGKRPTATHPNIWQSPTSAYASIGGPTQSHEGLGPGFYQVDHMKVAD